MSYGKFVKKSKKKQNMHTMHISLPPSLPPYLATYLPACLPTWIQMHIYIHTYIIETAFEIGLNTLVCR